MSDHPGLDPAVTISPMTKRRQNRAEVAERVVATVPPGFNSPEDQQMILSRLRRVHIYPPDAIPFAESLDPALVRSWSDAQLAAVVEGTLPSYPVRDWVSRADLDTAISNLLAGAPGALDTLKELAAALGDDANFASTVTTALAGKPSKPSSGLDGKPLQWDDTAGVFVDDTARENATYARPNDAGKWTPKDAGNVARAFNVGDRVMVGRVRFDCVTGHTTAGVFLTDLAAGRWVTAGRDVNSFAPWAGQSLLSSHGGVFGGGALSNGTDTALVSRTMHIAYADAVEIRPVFTNLAAGSTSGLNPITVECALEPPVAATATSGPVSTTVATTYPVTFNGASSATVQPGGVVIGDPVPMSISKYQYLYARTRVSVTSGQKWPYGAWTSSLDNSKTPVNPNGLTGGIQDGQASGGASSLLLGTGNIPAGLARTYGPVGFLATPVGGGSVFIPSAAIVGDSLSEGSGETFTDLGWPTRMLMAQGVPWINVALHGELAVTFAGVASQARLLQILGCTHVNVSYGRNDVTNGSYTNAQMQANLIAVWNVFYTRGMMVTAATITPRNNSTDNFRTNFTLADSGTIEAQRVFLNTWLRDGAPILNGVAVVAGSSAAGTLRAGMPGHPATAVNDITAQAESSLNSGFWKAPERVVTDAAASVSSPGTITSATANFTSADVGKTIHLVGAGTSGADLHSSIRLVNSSTSITLQFGANVATAVSGATLSIGISTDDGTHPNTSIHKAIAAAATLAV